MKKFEEFTNEGIFTDIKNRIINFDTFGSQMSNKKKEVLGLLRALVNKNDGITSNLDEESVSINFNDNYYKLYKNGKLIFPNGSKIHLDETDARKLYYEFLEKEIIPPKSGRDYAPKEEIKFPCVYYFLTDELEEKLRKKGEPIGIVNHGYAFYCETPEELEEKKEKYKVGNTYNGETITAVDIGKERDY